MKRGDLDKMSFAFYPEVQEWDEGGDTPLRTIKRAALADVSIVSSCFVVPTKPKTLLPAEDMRAQAIGDPLCLAQICPIRTDFRIRGTH